MKWGIGRTRRRGPVRMDAMANVRTRLRSAGFTLLEVLMATVLLAAGSVSIIMVLTAAAANATRRAEVKRIAEVFEEARRHAQSEVDGFRPSDTRKVPGPVKQAAPKKGAKGAKDAEAGTEDTDEIPSARYARFGYVVTYSPVNPLTPAAGYDATISIHYDGRPIHTDSVVVAPDSIPESEFQTSLTYEQERKGTDDSDAASETK